MAGGVDADAAVGGDLNYRMLLEREV